MWYTGAKAYTLRKGGKTLGVTERRGDRVRHYIVGFDNAHTTRKVQYFMAPNPVLRLERSNEHNVTQEVTGALQVLRCPTPSPSSEIIISTASRMYVPKMAPLLGGALHPLNDAGFHLHEMAMRDMFLMPFDENVGIVLPYDVEHEDGREMVLACSVIEPCDDSLSMRDTFERLMQ